MQTEIQPGKQLLLASTSYKLALTYTKQACCNQ